MIKKLEKAPRRFFHTKERVGKIGEIKEILRVKIPSFLKEAEKNFILNHKDAYSAFCNAFDMGQGSILRQ